jgi:membrane protease YdiL (CAAX protease family)
MNPSLELSKPSQRWQQRNWSNHPGLAVCEFALVALIFWADARHHIFLSKTLYLFPLAWLSLKLRGLGWRDVGLVRFHSWRKTLLAGVIVGAAMEVFELFVSQPLMMRWTGSPPDLELFRALGGSVKWTLIALAGTWTLAAFGEETVYRGYLMNRVAGVLGCKRFAWAGSLILVSVAFGVAHMDQGITGQLENLLDGLLLGGIYLASGRNLALAMMAHGIADTLDVLLIFAGLYPTLR